jgi:threonine aldolase
MDGARLFNAAAASNASPARIVRDFDTVSICLSKGLGAPVGSVLVGSKEILAEAHRWRKMFGGGMRQAGVIAATGLYALENNVDRLHDDHKRARRLAEAVNEIDGLSINLDTVQSNIVFIGVEKGKTQEVIGALSEQGVEILGIDDSTVRAVFHLHITDEDLEKAIEAFTQI